MFSDPFSVSFSAFSDRVTDAAGYCKLMPSGKQIAASGCIDMPPDGYSLAASGKCGLKTISTIKRRSPAERSSDHEVAKER
jgi:hypothetical protein